MRAQPWPARPGLRGIVLRLLAACAVCLPLAVLHGEALVRAALPAFAEVFARVADDFTLQALDIEHAGADRVVRATVIWRQAQVIGNHVIYPDPRGTATVATQLAHALQGPLAALIAACAFPLGCRDRRRWIEAPLRLAVLAPLVVLLMLADIPLVLAGELWKVVLDALAPGETSKLVLWRTFMQGGGRYALALSCAISAALAARSLVRLIRPAAACAG